MIVSSELRAWANDPERQREARHAADGLATSWGDGPIHRRFAESFADLPDNDAQAVIAAVEALFADDLWVDTLIATLAAEMHRNPFFEPPFRHISSDVHKGLIVYEDDHVSIAAGVSGVTDLAGKKSGIRPATSIAFSGQASVFKFVKSGGARLSFWRVPTITETFTASDAGRCERIGERAIVNGEILVLDGRCETFIIEQASSNIVILQASVKPGRAPVAVEYSSDSRAFVGCSAADDSASRIQMITTLLRKLGATSAVPAIAAFADHPNFFVRWHVMRDLIGLDPIAALPHLTRMAAGDPHPETREAARRTLVRLRQATMRKAA